MDKAHILLNPRCTTTLKVVTSPAWIPGNVSQFKAGSPYIMDGYVKIGTKKDPVVNWLPYH